LAFTTKSKGTVTISIFYLYFLLSLLLKRLNYNFEFETGEKIELTLDTIMIPSGRSPFSVPPAGVEKGRGKRERR
jgi:hypothetical protein